MIFDTHSNFGYGAVTVAPSPASSGTTLSMSTGDAANFPDPQAAGNNAYNIVVFPTGTNPLSSNAEIVRVTAKAAPSGGNVQFTITRQQEGSSARSIVVGDQVAQVVSNKILADIETPLVGNLSDFVVSGLVIPTSANLTATCPLGVIYIQNQKLSVAADGGHTYTASKDTYVDVDNTGAYHYSAVNNGAAAPALTANSIRIAKVVTGASAITSVLADGSRDSLGNTIYPSKSYISTVNTTAKARANLSGGTQSINASTFTKVNLDTISYDPGNNLDVATNHRFTAPVTGYYLVSGSVFYNSPTASIRYIGLIYVNGSNVAESQMTPSGGAGVTILMSDIIKLNKNDYVELYTYHESVGAKNVYNDPTMTYLSCHLLSV